MPEKTELHLIADRVQSIAQAGLTYTQNSFDLERYRELQDLAARLYSLGTGAESQHFTNLLLPEKGYATPKVDVRCVVLREGKMLFVREVVDGGWSLPGGWVDINDAPHQAAEREVWEESGFKVKATKLLALLDHRKHGFTPYFFHIFKLFFLCEMQGGVATPSFETTEVGFFGPDEIPPLSLARMTPQIVQMMFELAAQPDAPTLFD